MDTFQLIDTDGEILETFKTAEHRWSTGDTVTPTEAAATGWCR